MQTVVSESLLQYGLAGVFILLLCIAVKMFYEDGKRREEYIIKENEKREAKYLEVIEKNQLVIIDLSKKFDILEEMKKDMDIIKTVKNDVKDLKNAYLKK